MSDENLFGLNPIDLVGEPATEEPRVGAPRLLRPDRAQVSMQTASLDSLVAQGHRVRSMWRFVEGLDLSTLLDPIKSREHGPGRSAIDPRILLTLWLYGTSKGIGSAMEIDRLCTEHDAYRWICGGVSVNYHTISDFRSEHGEAFGELLEQLLATLMRAGVLSLKRVAQDGMRTRASAGAASFRREPTLLECQEEAKERVEKAAEGAKDPHRDRRRAAAQEAAAKGRLERVNHALEELPKVRASKRGTEEKTNARVSTTDPEARVSTWLTAGFARPSTSNSRRTRGAA
jgi:transposase